MTESRYAGLVARVLRRGTSSTRERTAEQDARAILEVERALLARRRSRNLRRAARWGATLAVAAAGVLVLGKSMVASSNETDQVIVLAHPSAGDVEVRVGGKTTTLADGTKLTENAEVLSGRNSEAKLELSTGTKLEVHSNTRVAVRERGPLQRFDLETGVLMARVAKLEPNQRFVISTPDAEVEVRGTQFEVSVAEEPSYGCKPEERTRVRVHEGVVEVRANDGVHRVGPGQEWPEPCEPVTAPSETPQPPAADVQPSVTAPTVHASPSKGPTPSSGTTAELAPSSNLVEQNDLFASGVAARRRGDRQTALAAYGDLIARFPGSALVENAMVERIHLLRASNPAQARVEARRYLARFPKGFAAGEVAKLLDAKGASGDDE